MAKIDLTHVPTIAKFMENNTAKFKILRGPIGSGKTMGCCFELMRLALLQERSPKDGVRYSRAAVIRNTSPQLRTTTIKSWEECFPDPPVVYSAPIRWHLKIPGELDFEILFVALDKPNDIRNLLSLNLSFAYINECREIDQEITTRLFDRIGRYPSVGQQGTFATHPIVIADTNPASEDHYLYEWEMDPPEGVDFYVQPPAIIDVTDVDERPPGNVIKANGREYLPNPDAENVPNLIPGYYQNKVPLNTRENIRVYFCNQWGTIGEGKPCVPEFDDQVHSFNHLPVLENEPFLVGIDVGGGTLSPSAIIFQRGRRGNVLIHAEVVCYDMGVDAFSRVVHQEFNELFPGKTIAHGWADPACMKRDEIYETVVADHLRSKGINVRPAPGNNDIDIRVQAIRNACSRMIDGKPALMVHRRCKTLRAGLAGKWVFRRLQTSTERYQEKPDKNRYSHICDATSYALLGIGEYQAIKGQQRSINMHAITVNTGWDAHG